MDKNESTEELKEVEGLIDESVQIKYPNGLEIGLKSSLYDVFQLTELAEQIKSKALNHKAKTNGGSYFG